MSKRNYIKKTEFFAKYKHPNWQKKRLEVMSLSHFQCDNCGDADTTLNVHHKFYISGRDPWEYENHELQCLCEPCHQSIHAMGERLNSTIQKYKAHESYDPHILIGFLEGLMCDGPWPVDPLSWEWLRGFACAQSNTASELVDAAIKDDAIHKEMQKDWLEVVLMDKMNSWQIEHHIKHGWVNNRLIDAPDGIKRSAARLLERSGVSQ